MKLSELSKFTNQELKNILRENQIKNYSKLNKKDLVKKVNNMLNNQNGGKKKYKKYTLKDIAGGAEPDEKESGLQNPQAPIVKPRKNIPVNATPLVATAPPLNNSQASAPVATAPPLNGNTNTPKNTANASESTKDCACTIQ